MKKLFLSVVVLLLSCQLFAQVKMKFNPETDQKYATIEVYSTSTGKFERWILKEEGWQKSEIDFNIKHNVDKGNMVWEFSPETDTKYATMIIYSRNTGAFERWILKEKGWEKSEINFKNIAHNVDKGSLVMEFLPETDTNYATMFIYSEKSGKYERWVYKEEKWLKQERNSSLEHGIN